MPQWSGRKAINAQNEMRSVPFLMKQKITELCSYLDDAVRVTSTLALGVLQNATPVQSGNLKNSWHIAEMKTLTQSVYTTGNDAKSYDPGGGGEFYARYVELGLSSKTRGPRAKGPAYMLSGNMPLIADIMISQIERIT